jgi:protein-tyrosine phosphatase
MEDAEVLPPAVLREGVAFVLDQKAQGGTVLIACSGGFSRSVALAAAVLKEAEGLRLSEALEEIKGQHTEAAPHPVLWESLCDYYNESRRRFPSRKREHDG